MADPTEPDQLADLLTEAQIALVHTLKPIATEMELSIGQTLFRQGDQARDLFVLLTGRLEVSALSEAGRKMSLNILRENQVFGEIAIFDQGRRTATVEAIAPSRVMRIGAKDLLAAMRQNPDIALALLRLSVGRARWVSDQMEDLAFATLNVRMARRLLFLFRSIADNDGSVPVSQHALADHVGATREAVSKALARWKKDKIVETHRGRIVVCNLAKLELLAELGPI